MELRAPWKISGVKVRKNDNYFITILKRQSVLTLYCGNFKDGATADLETANSKQNEKKELDEVSGIKKLWLS